MAEGAFIEVVEEVIGKTGNLADQDGLSWRVQNELEKLRNTVLTIKAMVLDAEQQPKRNRYVSEWLRLLKDAVYEAVNLLEEFSSEVSRRDQMTQNKEAKKGTTTSMPGNHVLPSFSRLSKLCIRACPQLVSMPFFPFLENLKLYYCSFKPLEQKTGIAAAEATGTASASSSTRATSSFAPLPKLRCMEIGQMEEPLPEECMQNLISLDRLWIYEYRGPLLQGIRHLTALKQLEICSSELFDLSNYGMESLPEGIQHMTSLRKLTIDYCPCLTALPEWIFILTSLEILEILQCPKLQSLPVGIRRLTSLHTLKIRYCPILSQRCKKEIGRDWPQISHITNLDLEPENSDGEPNKQQKKFDLLRIRT